MLISIDVVVDHYLKITPLVSAFQRTHSERCEDINTNVDLICHGLTIANAENIR